jgi:hypothetical protein
MERRPRFPQTEYTFYALKGGLDIVSPAISIDPGKVLDSQNYEPTPIGGYRRVDGYERFDGRTSPTSASYWIMTATITGTLAVGNTITGDTSAATGKILAISGSTLVLGRVTGTFVSGEPLEVAAVPQATSTSAALQSGATSPTDDAAYKLLAANDLRTDILTVPGSGAIRGVKVYKDVVYAFRDNAGGTAGEMYKSTSGGWSLVAFGKEIQFTGAVGEVFVGNTITGLTSGATATVVKPMLRTGTWTVSGVGTLILSGVVGVFQNGEALQVGGITKVTSSSLQTNITRAAGGNLEFVNANFSGSTDTLKMYGADGVNPAFEFDGTNYIPIRTGMTTDTPTHIAFHRNYLILSFLGSLQISSIADPYMWSIVTGAAEIGMGDEITAILPQTGDSQGASMSVFTKNRTSILYGTSAANFTLINSVTGLGYRARTVQPVGSNTYGLTARGIHSLVTTLNYGDFDFLSLSFLIQPLIDRKFGTETASNTLRAKNQYRIYFSDGTAFVCGLTGEQMNGIMVLNYGRVVRCIDTSNLTNGTEVTYFGSDDGYVYHDLIGTSFDGEAIEAWIRPVFNNIGSPRIRKTYRRAIFEVSSEALSRVNITYDIGYATPETTSAAVQLDQNLIGSGGYWDQFTWDQFVWDSPVVQEASLSIDGCEKNISFLFYSNSAEDAAHIVSGVSLLYTPRRIQR